MKKAEKVTLVKNLANELNSSKSLIMADITGIRVNDQNRLRKMLASADAKLIVVKNTLLSRAIGNAQNLKSLLEQVSPSLTGQTAVIISQSEEVQPVQTLGKFIKELEMPKLKVGIISGNIYDESALIRVSKLPGKEILVAQVVGALSGPLYGLVETLQGNIQKLVYILNAKAQGGEMK